MREVAGNVATDSVAAEATASSTPVQVSATIVSAFPDGAYVRLVIDAPAVAQAARPGQFVAIAVGTPKPGTTATATLLRRSFSIASTHPGRGHIELLISAAGPGSTWLTERAKGDVIDLIGPLGKPFPMPADNAGCVLVGGGYGAAPMVWWAKTLMDAGHRVAFVLGAASEAKLAEATTATMLDVPLAITTDDGSAGYKGRVTDALPTMMDFVRGDEAVEVYACGPMAMLRACEDVAAAEGGVAWCATEESMACGIGVCMTCVIPIYDASGTVRNARTCIEGPTFPGSVIAWDQIGRVIA